MGSSKFKSRFFRPFSLVGMDNQWLGCFPGNFWQTSTPPIPSFLQAFGFLKACCNHFPSDFGKPPL